MNSKQRLRTRLAGLGVLVAGLVLSIALYRLSILDHAVLSARAAAQYDRPAAALFDRGTIFFDSKDGIETAAASIESGYLLYMNPKKIVDASGEYEVLAQYLSLDRADFLAKAAKTNDPYEELMHHLDSTTGKNIAALKLPGIFVTPEIWRAYPGGSLAAHEIGILGQDAASAEMVGRYGLERSYDGVLYRPSLGSSSNIFAQIFAGLGTALGGNSDDKSRPGDIVTTIEPTVQTYLEKMIAETEATWHGDEVGGIIMDPNTGEIVAMSSWPSFDPNNTATVKNISVFANPLVENVYEMGSIMKPLTMSAALDSGVVQPDSTYDDTGCLVLNGRRICNYDGRARGVIPMQQILSQSLNVGASTLALKMGAATFAHYFESFGLGSRTDIDLPNEALPIVHNLQVGSDIDIATASYGQGIAVSPVGMIRALSVIANGGYLVRPHLVKEIDYTDGTVDKIGPDRVGPVLKPQTVEEVKQMLSIVVDTALANGHIKKEHYTMAAKTGTAEMADPVHGGYYQDRYLHSFFGFLPAFKPRFIIFLYHTYPKGAEYASETLTKPFDDLATFLINYYNIPPDR